MQRRAIALFTPTLQNMMDIARLADEAGFDSVWNKEPEYMIAGVLFPIEQGRWIVTIAGMAKYYPPSDEEGFMATLAKLRSPILAEAVHLAEPISPVIAIVLWRTGFDTTSAGELAWTVLLPSVTRFAHLTRSTGKA